MPRGLVAVLLAGLVVPFASVGETPSPYAGLDSRPVKAFSAQEIDDLRSGRGMGLALAAELNGYPGPRHVIELAESLQLTAEQRIEAERLFEEMQDGAVLLGVELLKRERELEELFAERRATADAIAAASAAAAQAQGALRGHHLKYHLAMAELLTPHQVTQYNSLRGYGGATDSGGHGKH